MGKLSEIRFKTGGRKNRSSCENMMKTAAKLAINQSTEKKRLPENHAP
jgi:hypothetical protein